MQFSASLSLAFLNGYIRATYPPTYLPTYIHTAYVYAVLKGDLKAAQAASQKAVTLSPNDVMMKERLRAICVEQGGEVEKWIQALPRHEEKEVCREIGR